MSGDYTRFSFDPTKGFSGVHEQQGRVSLDSDANEFEEILDRRDRSEMFDTVGPAVVPATTPTGFEIGVSGPSLTIGIGRVYVDGIQAECFGDLSDPKDTAFEPRVGSVVGNKPLLFDDQPFVYKPNFPGLPTASGVQCLVYLDVWQREVTVWEDRSLLEPALGGPDTATRVQTAWQVKALAGGAAVDCTLPAALIAPSTARMTAIAAPAPPAPGPCVIAPAGGYTGLENRLYRVEVQQAGTLAGLNPATFKWSRDDASLVASVLNVAADGTGSIITVESTGRDTWMRFEVGQQLELLDDGVEFAMRESGQGGDIARITNINHATGEIRVDQDLSAFAIIGLRHPRVRRWDTAKPADPAVVAVNNGTAIPLEHGIYITFGDLLAGTLHDGDTLHAGDYWVFAARTADGSIEAVLNEPPRGILHHFMPLAIVTSGSTPVVDSDCRDPWPVPCNCDGGGCECDACVSVGSHMDGTLTIQDAIDKVIAAGGGTVCIGIGLFKLEATVRIEKAVSLRVCGAGIGTILSYQGQEPAVVVQSSLDVIVRDLSVVTERDRGAPQDAVEVIDAAMVTLERLVVIEDLFAIIDFLDSGKARPSGGAVGLGGFTLRTTVRDCVLAGGVGILSRPWLTKDPDDYLVTADLTIDHDLIFASGFGIALGTPEEAGAVHFIDRTSIADCSIYGCEQVGIMLSGTVTEGHIDVRGGRLGVIGRGIQVSTDCTTLADNTLATWRDAELPVGLKVVRGDRDIVRDIQILGNRIDRFAGGGITIETSVDNLAVADNTLRWCGNGIVMARESSGDTVTIASNTIIDVEPRGRQEGAFGVRLVRTIDGSVTDNTIKRVATSGEFTPWRAGVQTLACSAVRIAGNVIEEIGPIAGDGRSYGIAAEEPFERLDVVDNTVRPNVKQSFTEWFALFIGDARTRSKMMGVLVGTSVYVTVGLSLKVLAAVDRGGSLAARGNHLDAAGPTAAVRVETRGSCTFTDNWCRLLAKPTAPVVQLFQPILALATNQVRQPRGGDSAAIEVKVMTGPAPDPPGLALTALGNLTDGLIFVNGSLLPAPWDGLNVRLS